MSEQFREYKPPTKEELKKAKQKNRQYRKMKYVMKAKNDPDSFDTELGVCWMCWMDITGQELIKWRNYPYSEVKLHEEVCPLCGYDHWKGRIWFPFRYLRGYIGNPSSRNGMKEK